MDTRDVVRKKHKLRKGYNVEFIETDEGVLLVPAIPLEGLFGADKAIEKGVCEITKELQEERRLRRSRLIFDRDPLSLSTSEDRHVKEVFDKVAVGRVEATHVRLTPYSFASLQATGECHRVVYHLRPRNQRACVNSCCCCDYALSHQYPTFTHACMSARAYQRKFTRKKINIGLYRARSQFLLADR